MFGVMVVLVLLMIEWTNDVYSFCGATRENFQIGNRNFLPSDS